MKNIFNLSKIIRFICISPYIITSIIVSISPANAQGAAIGRQVSKTLGQLFQEGFASGAGRQAGSLAVISAATGAQLVGEAAQRYIESGQTYVIFGTVYQNGQPYRVCQHFQGNRPVSYIYYC